MWQANQPLAHTSTLCFVPHFCIFIPRMNAFESPATYTRSGSPGARCTSAGTADGVVVAADTAVVVVVVVDEGTAPSGGATRRGDAAVRSTLSTGVGGVEVATSRAATTVSAAVAKAIRAVRAGNRRP